MISSAVHDEVGRAAWGSHRVNARRAEAVRALATRPFDALVVGGGIIGSGIARDLALRGWRVALVEQHDLASGTSSRPTRLIHGGLRYLEMLDFGLVRSDMREREILLRVAPHLVFPLPFLMPLYGASLFAQTRLRAGMQLYDMLSYDKSLPTRRWLDRPQTLRAEPTLRPDGLQGAWRFYDAQVPLVERLVVENALDAAAHGAVVVNHARVTRLLREPDDQGAVTGAVVEDLQGGGTLDVRARCTIKATGPWLDLGHRGTGLRTEKPPLLRLTKGVHLVTPSVTRHAHVLFARSDGRLFFVVPWLGMSLVGTTDTDYHGDPAHAEATEDDVRYLVAEARRAFPGAPFDQVYYTWAGVRALVRMEGVQEGRVSRKHAIHDHEAQERVRGVLSVVGGKITAYRGIAEEVGDLVSARLGRRALGYTDRRPLPGGVLRDPCTFVEHELWPRAKGLGLPRETADHLGHVYGALAMDVLDRVQEDRSLAEPVCPHDRTIAAQLARAVEAEWASTLGDVLLRRLPLGFAPHQGLDCLDGVARLVGDRLGWDRTERQSQIEAYRREVAPMRRQRAVGLGVAPPVPPAGR